MKTDWLYLSMVLLATACSPYGSNTQEFTINDLSEPTSHEFSFDDLEENEFVYKYKLRISGEVDGKVVYNGRDTLIDLVNETKSGDWYQSSFLVSLAPVGDGVIGELTFKLTLYY